MLPFQENAVLGTNGLVETFKKLWQTGGHNLDITFKSPTGSGKTFMVSNFVFISLGPYGQRVCSNFID